MDKEDNCMLHPEYSDDDDDDDEHVSQYSHKMATARINY